MKIFRKTSGDWGIYMLTGLITCIGLIIGTILLEHAGVSQAWSITGGLGAGAIWGGIFLYLGFKA